MAESTKFPLHLHATGQWRKKIRGRHHYFGTDKDAALERYVRERPYLDRGELPPAYPCGKATLRDVCDAFLADRDSKRKAGEITPRTFAEYLDVAQRMCDGLGKDVAFESITPATLLGYRRKLQRTRNSVSLGSEIGRCRVILRFAYENGIVDRPIRFGDFRKPAKRQLRRERAGKGSKLATPAELRALLENADVQLRGMILLGVNCGFSGSDCGQLPASALDLKNGWLEFPRPKTGVDRRCPLWPETVEALQAALDARKNPDGKLVFVTKYGNPWIRPEAERDTSAIPSAFAKLAEKAGVKRAGLTFGALRHTCLTIGEESGDPKAASYIMGHIDASIGAEYRERFSDERLLRVVNHVRGGLLGEGGAA